MADCGGYYVVVVVGCYAVVLRVFMVLRGFLCYAATVVTILRYFGRCDAVLVIIL